MSSIVFAHGDFERLRKALIASIPRESAAVLLAGQATGTRDARLLVREIHIPPPSLVDAGPTHVTVAPAFFMPLVKKARLFGWSVIFVHTHPFSEIPQFSSVDDATEISLFETIDARAPDRPHASIVLGTTGVRARTRSSGSMSIVHEVRDVADVVQINREDDGPPLGEELDRTVRALGEAGQRRLRSLRVAVVGVGGIGSHVAQQLAHLAVGNLVLVDDDALEASNLNRVVGSSADAVGKNKVDVIAAAISHIGSGVNVTALADSVLRVDVARQLAEVDAIFCCTDTHGSRAVLNQLAYQYYVPTFDAGVRIDVAGGVVTRVSGRTQMLAPGLGCLVCSGLLDYQAVRRDLQSDDERARDPYIVGHSEPQPSVVSLNGTVSSLAVTMFLGAFVGFATRARYQIYRADTGTVRAAVAPRDPSCLVCSASGALGRGDLLPLTGRTD